MAGFFRTCGAILAQNLPAVSCDHVGWRTKLPSLPPRPSLCIFLEVLAQNCHQCHLNLMVTKPSTGRVSGLVGCWFVMLRVECDRHISPTHTADLPPCGLRCEAGGTPGVTLHTLLQCDMTQSTLVLLTPLFPRTLHRSVWRVPYWCHIKCLAE